LRGHRREVNVGGSLQDWTTTTRRLEERRLEDSTSILENLMCSLLNGRIFY
jgi:hypothetical protein